jgi:hypothetical protein
MTDASAILASLDRFIERFGHQVATEEYPVATSKSLIRNDVGHSGHCGHSKQDCYAENDLDHSKLSGSPDVDPAVRLARKVLFNGGHNGHNGQSFLKQPLIRGQCENPDGHSGQHPFDQKLVSGDPDHSGYEPWAPSDVFLSNPTWWQDLFFERAAHREFDGGYPRAEAELLAWREIEWRWHMEHSERVPGEVCAGCHEPMEGALDLIDGARVHIDRYRCRIAYEQRWRAAAAAALIVLSVQPPAADFERVP